MRYKSVTTCIDCGQRPPMTKKRLCKECWMPKSRESNKKSYAKRKAEKQRRTDWVTNIMKKKEPEPLPETTEVLKGYLNYVYPRDYAGIRNL